MPEASMNIIMELWGLFQNASCVSTITSISSTWPAVTLTPTPASPPLPHLRSGHTTMSLLPSPSSTSPTSSHLVCVHHHQPPVPLHCPPRGHSLRRWIRVTQLSLPVGGCCLLTLCCWCLQPSSLCYYATCRRTGRSSTKMGQRDWPS